MLWQSILHGLRILAHWQTYAVGAGMTVIVVFPKLYLALLRDRNMYGETPLRPIIVWYLIRHHAIDRFEKLIDRAYKGQWGGGWIGVLFVGIAEFWGGYFAILTLMPLMLGLGTDANWATPWLLPIQHPAIFFRLIGLLLVAVILVAQIPFVGETLVSPIMMAVILNKVGITAAILVPQFWMCCGILASGVIVRYAVIGIGAVIVAFMPHKIVYSSVGALTKAICFSLLPVLQLLPAFIYAGWVTLQPSSQ
jgi:hypothetical protein